MTDPDKNPENNDNNLLTGIHHAYTVGDTNENESDEMNELMIKHFIDTLAEVSLSIASRKVEEKDQ